MSASNPKLDLDSNDPDDPGIIDDDQPQYAERPNKAEGKRETNALKALANEMAEFPASKLAQLGLNEKTLEAFEVFNRIKSRARAGRKRQLLLLIKLLREQDLTTTKAILAGERLAHRAQSLELDHVATTRDELIASDDLLEQFLEQHQLDGEFRTLVRQARREQAKNGKPHAQRALFRQLQSLLSKQEPEE